MNTLTLVKLDPNRDPMRMKCALCFLEYQAHHVVKTFPDGRQADYSTGCPVCTEQRLCRAHIELTEAKAHRDTLLAAFEIKQTVQPAPVLSETLTAVCACDTCKALEEWGKAPLKAPLPEVKPPRPGTKGGG